MTYRSVEIEHVRHYVRCHCTSREQYNEALKVLATMHDWTLAEIGILKCEISGHEGPEKLGAYCYGEIRTLNEYGQTMHLWKVEGKTRHEARSKAVKQMLAWVKQSNGFARTVVPMQGEGTHDAGSGKTN